MNHPSIHFSLSTYRAHHLQQAYIKQENELECIYHLTESHCPVFRHKGSSLYAKAKVDENHAVFPMLKDNINFECQKNVDTNRNIEDLLQKVKEMPSEWTLVQITPQINLDLSKKYRGKQHPTPSLHLTVFHCGQAALKPISVLRKAPVDVLGNKMEIMKQLDVTKDEINEGYQKMFDRLKGGLKETYSEYKSRLSYSMKDLIRSVQEYWLGPWRVLFMGQFVHKEMETRVENCLEKLLKEFNITANLRSKTLIKYAIKGQNYLQAKEVREIVRYALPELEIETLVNVVKEIKKCPVEFAKEQKHPVILIVDASVDSVPWEMLDVLDERPVSRMQSFHFTYALYSEHEAEIVNGRKILANPPQGRAILNPDLDLERMEKRMRSFFNYWLPSWKLMYGKRPSEEEFLDVVMNSDIFCYCGHGDGFQFITSNNLQKLRVGAVILLFGCSSVRLESLGPLCEPQGTNQNYITSCSPCIIGNLWNIGDLQSDKLSTTLISHWVASSAKTHWSNVDLNQWQMGEKLVKLSPLDSPRNDVECTSDLLLALNKAKKHDCNFLTQAACVARGIPVKIGP